MTQPTTSAWTTVQAVTVAGNAASLTVPTVGTAYAVRALRRGGVAATALWPVGAAAVVTTVVLVFLAPLGIATGGLLPVAAGITVSAVLAAVVAALLRPRADRHPTGPQEEGAPRGRWRAVVARGSAWAPAHSPFPRDTTALLEVLCDGEARRYRVR